MSKLVAAVVAALILLTLLAKHFWWIVGLSFAALSIYLIVKAAKGQFNATDTAAAVKQATPPPLPPPPLPPPRRPTIQPPSKPRAKPATASPPPPAPIKPIGKPVVARKTPTKGVAKNQPNSGIVRVDFTRKQTPHASSAQIYTAIDLETTGLDPKCDRIVEIGLVKFTADGQILDEFATLVNNPGSSWQAREVHQINDDDLVGAPDIKQVLQEVFAFIAGTVVVSHNLEFETGFLTQAARDARLSMPLIGGVCTMQTSRRQMEGRSFSLTVMYKSATGEFPINKHTALGDARSIREVMLWLLRNAPSALNFNQAPPPAAVAPARYECHISCRPVPLTNSSVAELLNSFPQSPNDRTGDTKQIEKYLAMLAESVEDGLLTFDEARELTRQARLTRLSGTQLRGLHRAAWDATFAEEKDADWKSLTPVKRREMYLLADALGLPELAANINEAIEACVEPPPPADARWLRSLRIGIVGDSEELVTLRAKAELHGAKLAVNITKTVKWMATATPDATDARHNSARKFGVPILSPSDAARRLDDAIRDAEIRAYERQREADAYTAQRMQYAAQQEAYWRPTWRKTELDRDPSWDDWD